jgi:hypothetical protein
LPDPLAPLYRRVLGSRFDTLPRQVRDMHDVQSIATVTGTCEVDRGRNPIARFIGRIFKMPPAGADVPVTLTFVPTDGREVWCRDFGGARFQTVQEPCPDNPGHLIERFGAMAFLLEVPVTEHGLCLELRRVALLGIPLPRRLWPRIKAEERVVNGAFAFDVLLKLPLAGPLIHYRGTLRTDAARQPAQSVSVGPAT